MKIDNDQQLPKQGFVMDGFRRPASSDDFEKMLEADRLKADTLAARNEVLSKQAAPKENENKDDIAFIREHGMTAYAKEMHKRKIEELREKILEAMGLSEEALEDMPADQRLAIEKIIAREIQKRMAADAISNGENSAGDTSRKASGGNAQSAEHSLAARVLAGDPGTFIGLVIADAKDGEDIKETKSEASLTR